MEIEDILKSFEIFDGVYKREAVEEALARRDEITPHLISILDKVLEEPKQYADINSNFYGHIYSYMLLGYFREEKAHKVIVDLFSLPEEIIDPLFGDFITENLPIVLLRTCGGKTEKIKELILNQNAYEFCRGSAIKALSYAMIENYISREEILKFYGELFCNKPAPIGSFFYNIVAASICFIYPEELMETIKKAYEEDLVNPFYITYEAFTEVLKDGKEKCIENLKKMVQYDQIEDIHHAMSKLAHFNQQKKNKTRYASSYISKSKLKQDLKAKKLKKKQSKASRKENRKRKK